VECSDDPYGDGDREETEVEGKDKERDEAGAKVDGVLAVLQEGDEGEFFARMG